MSATVSFRDDPEKATTAVCDAEQGSSRTGVFSLARGAGGRLLVVPLVFRAVPNFCGGGDFAHSGEDRSDAAELVCKMEALLDWGCSRWGELPSFSSAF